jgi:hypothetical protein
VTLNSLGIDLDNTAPIIYVLDTFLIAQKILRGNFCLGALLDAVDCPHAYLRNAGNDANFTLRALLLLAVQGCQSKSMSLSEAEHATMSCLELTARSNFPARMGRLDTFRRSDPYLYVKRLQRVAREKRTKRGKQGRQCPYNRKPLGVPFDLEGDCDKSEQLFDAGVDVNDFWAICENMIAKHRKIQDCIKIGDARPEANSYWSSSVRMSFS